MYPTCPDSDQMREYYIGSLTNFYQVYLTSVRLTFELLHHCSINEPHVQLAAGSYFTDGPTSATRAAYLSGWQTRLFVSTRFCWALITVLSVSTALTLLAQLQQQPITLPIDTSPDMLITNLKLGRSFNLKDLDDLQRYANLEDLETKLNQCSVIHKRGKISFVYLCWTQYLYVCSN
jgi:hypothetical protein